jgi:hypothetical protein
VNNGCVAGPGDAPVGTGGMASLPASSDEFHSTERPGVFSPGGACEAVRSPDQTASGGGETFGLNAPGSDQGPPPRGPGETFGSDSPGSDKGQPPTQSKPTPTPSPGTGQQPQTDCVPEADPQTQTRLRKTGSEALNTIAAMGQQADRLLTAMGQVITGQLAYYTQPSAKIWNDRTEAMQAVLRLLWSIPRTTPQ